jgi:small subunit ribosomal protein S16
MLTIRLQRTGRENVATYRIVVVEKARAAKGKFLEIIGFYLPQRTPAVLDVKKDRVVHWVKFGAHPSSTLARLLKKAGVEGMERFILKYTKRKPKGEAPAEPQTSAASNPAEKS